MHSFVVPYLSVQKNGYMGMRLCLFPLGIAQSQRHLDVLRY